MDDFAGGAAATDAGVTASDAMVTTDAIAATDGSEAGPKPVCTGGRITGIAAFDATPAGAKGSACAVDNALIADDKVTGLEADDYAGSVPLDGVAAHGCVGVEFEAPTRTVFLRVAATGNACGAACLAGYCGQGDYAEVYAAPSRAGYRFVIEVTTTSTLGERMVAVPQGTRVVLVCRGGWSKDKDDVAVDAITAACP